MRTLKSLSLGIFLVGALAGVAVAQGQQAISPILLQQARFQ